MMLSFGSMKPQKFLVRCVYNNFINLLLICFEYLKFYSRYSRWILSDCFIICQDSAHLTVSNVRTLPMNDDVIVVAVSPTGSYLAVALLNCFIEVRLLFFFYIYCVSSLIWLIAYSLFYLVFDLMQINVIVRNK